ncbi:hypothetical protein E2C01_068481 [Portunus trituberculatus]|uniref:Uncharacterized protein n=1 Tax=Portunus trituberculatus TaxID=210409 RepID=A0A5B7HMI3_PORTR|nr:hypothetical protein [Portunus trituberculatus]
MEGHCGRCSGVQVPAARKATEAEICNGSARGEARGLCGWKEDSTPGLVSFTTCPVVLLMDLPPRTTAGFLLT